MKFKFIEPYAKVDCTDDKDVTDFFVQCKQFSHIVTESGKLQISTTHSAALSVVSSHIEALSHSSDTLVIDGWERLTVRNFLCMTDDVVPEQIGRAHV